MIQHPRIIGNAIQTCFRQNTFDRLRSDSSSWAQPFCHQNKNNKSIPLSPQRHRSINCRSLKDHTGWSLSIWNDKVHSICLVELISWMNIPSGLNGIEKRTFRLRIAVGTRVGDNHIFSTRLIGNAERVRYWQAEKRLIQELKVVLKEKLEIGFTLKCLLSLSTSASKSVFSQRIFTKIRSILTWLALESQHDTHVFGTHSR